MDPRKDESSKICSTEELVARRSQSRALGERVVQCHGCFDIVHPGHVRHLEHARSLGDRLVVSITADAFIDKGTSRPLFDERLRAGNLAALACVDWVVVNPSPTAVELLGQVQPDLYVKGAEYEHNEDPRFAAERDAVEAAGGRVLFSSGDVVFSSTAIIDAMRHSAHAFDTTNDDPRAVALNRLMRSCDLSPERIRDELHKVRGRRVLIIGESILDTYVDCGWPDVTTESPILSLRPRHRRFFDGGAAVIARHLAAAGAQVTLITPMSSDPSGSAMKKRLEAAGITIEPIPFAGRLPEKERFLVGRDKVVKLDHTVPIELDHKARGRLIALAADHASHADAAIITDYGLGLFGPKLTTDLFAAIRPRVAFIAGDVSGPRSTLLHMHHADWLTPSERELRGAVASRTDSLPAVTLELIEQTAVRSVALTMAEEGVVVFQKRAVAGGPDGQALRLTSQHIPALNQTPMDPLGCGDAFLAYSTVTQAGGLDATISAYIGSLAAAISAASLGNPPCNPEELIRLAARLHAGSERGHDSTHSASSHLAAPSHQAESLI